MLKNNIPIKCINTSANIEMLKNCFIDKIFSLFSLLTVLIRGYIPNKYPKFGVNMYPNEPPSQKTGKINNPIKM